MTATDSTGDSVAATATADDISTRIDRLPFLPYHWRIAGILGTGTLFDAFDSLSIGAALTMIIATFSLDFRSAGTLISAAFAGQFVGAIAFGYIGERIGRKWAFVVALTIFGLCSIAAALAQSVDQIIVARVIQGVGLGAEVPLAAALFTEFVRGSARGRFIMIYESVFVWGIFLAPVAGLACYALFGPALGWRVLFALGGLPLIVAAIAAWRLPESPRWLASKGRLAEAETMVADMEDEAQRLGKKLLPTHRVTVAPQTTRFSELFRGIYGKRTFVVWTMWFSAYFISNGFQSWAPTLYMKIGGLPASSALMLTILSGAVQLATCYVIAISVDKHGRRPWFAGGFALAAVAALVGAIVTGPMGMRGWEPLLACGIVMTVGTGANSLGVYLYTPELYPTRMRAWATATGSSMNRLGSFIAPSIVGWILAEYANIALAFTLFAVVGAFAAAVVWFMGEETKRRVLEELSP
ncbi:MAG TPA: MFS transporter [Stellaceae bacterium]|nr:MFS transporter [Stellaceae bacterium]